MSKKQAEHPKIMSVDYIKLIKKVNLFRGLNESSLHGLLSLFSLIELEENEVLFLQGDRSGSMYILLSGYLSATLKTKNSQFEQIGKIYPGEVVGEIGLLTKQPRSLTIRAITPSKLLELSEAHFMTFVKSNPDAIYEMLISSLKRSKNTIDLISNEKINKRIFMTSANGESLKKTPFIQHLKKLIANQKSILMIEEGDLAKIYHSRSFNEMINYLDKFEQGYNTVIYYIEGKKQIVKNLLQLTNLLLERSNILAIIGFGNEKPEFSEFNLEILNHQAIQNLDRKLILLWKKNTHIKNTRYWLEKAKFNLHHHLFLEDEQSYLRLLRFFVGKPIGLVLSGGGFRGFSHVGVIKALNEKNIPIDAIGGTSVGAGTAAFYLISNNEKELDYYVEKASDSIRKSLNWNSLTFPIISLYSYTPSTNLVRLIFANQRIEDLPIPYFAISCNISNNTEVIHKSHKIWRATRASSAVPAIFSPLVDHGQLLYDGGLLNNFPTDRMREIIGESGILIGSDLGLMMLDKTCYAFPPTLSPMKLLAAKILRRKKRYVFPPFFSTILKAMLIGSLPKYQRNVQLVNYYIHPDFSKYNPGFIEKASESELVQLGYENALAILKNWNYDAEN